MDPIKAGLSLYEAGGLALLLLAIIVASGFFIFRFFVGLIRDIGADLTSVRKEFTVALGGVIRENTDASRNLQSEVARQTLIISQQTEVMRGRPCLVESGVHQRPAGLPRTV